VAKAIATTMAIACRMLSVTCTGKEYTVRSWSYALMAFGVGTAATSPKKGHKEQWLWRR
jgi:hypothetical protein